jgi:hypothetical protein
VIFSIQKVLSNSEDLQIQTWSIEESNAEEQDDTFQKSQMPVDIIMNNRGSMKSNEAAANFERSFASSMQSPNEASSTNASVTGAALSLTNDDDVDDLSFIPPPMNVIKAEQSEQSSTKGTTSSFNSKIPNQSIDIQRELKIWQSKMENSKKNNNNKQPKYRHS